MRIVFLSIISFLISINFSFIKSDEISLTIRLNDKPLDAILGISVTCDIIQTKDSLSGNMATIGTMDCDDLWVKVFLEKEVYGFFLSRSNYNGKNVCVDIYTNKKLKKQYDYVMICPKGYLVLTQVCNVNGDPVVSCQCHD